MLLEAGIRSLESNQNNDQTTRDNVNLRDDYGLYRSYSRLLMVLNGKSQDSKLQVAALEASERSRAQALVTRLTSWRVRTNIAEDLTLVLRKRELSVTVAVLTPGVRSQHGYFSAVI